MKYSNYELTPERKELMRLYDEALSEGVRAILDEISKGKKPERAKLPVVSLHENGLPAISNNIYDQNGFSEYSTILEPPFGDVEARRKGPFPPDRFPAYKALFDYITENPSTSPTYYGASGDGMPDQMEEISIRFHIQGAIDAHFLRYGEVDTSIKSRESVLRRIFCGLFSEQLSLALVVPVAFVKFDFDRYSLGAGAYIIRMSEALQQSRWKRKAYGANGHDSVLSAATHAIVFTGWSIKNREYISLVQSLSFSEQESQEILEQFFAAFRLETGLDTGYAQELYLARGWRLSKPTDRPSVFAAGARRYPEHFDNFGWVRNDVPIVTREQIQRVAQIWHILKLQSDERLSLALRRFNAAMLRTDPADSVLDATIALEILLGDTDNQAISWKLRMRAAALLGIEGSKADMDKVHNDVKKIYEYRSIIVHGLGKGKKSKKTIDPYEIKALAIETVRCVVRVLATNPQYLDPLEIDRNLLMTPQLKNSD